MPEAEHFPTLSPVHHRKYQPDPGRLPLHRQQNNFEEMLISNDEAMVRSFPTAEITNYKDVNPSVMIFDMPLEKVKEVCAVTKFDSGLLVVVDEIPENLTVRAEAFDYIKRPVNPIEFSVRVEALGKVMKYKNGLKTIAITDELTGLYNRKYLHSSLLLPW